MGMLFAGCIVVVIFGLFTVWAGLGELSKEAHPPSRSVAEAMRSLGEAKRSPVAVLEDLSIDCDAPLTFDGDVHVWGHDAVGHRVLVRIPEERTCAAVARDRIGSLSRLRPRQRRTLKIPEAQREQVARFSPQSEASFAWLLVPLSFCALGGAFIRAGLRRRRRLLAQWREQESSVDEPVMAEARDSTSGAAPPLGSGPVDPLLGVQVSLDERFISSFGGQRRFWRAVRWGGLASAFLLMSFTIQLTLDRHRTWDRGVPARADIDGHVDHQGTMLLHHTEVAVAYEDAEGEVHTGRTTNWSLLWSGDSRHFEVRYRADDPSDFVLSTIVQQTPGTLLLGALASLLLAALGFVDRHRIPRLTERQVRALMWNLRTVELKVTHRFRPMEADEEESLGEVFSFRTPRPTHAFDVTIGDLQPGPLFLDRQEERALGLRNPDSPEHVFLVRADMFPLARPRPRPNEVRARWRRRKAQRAARAERSGHSAARLQEISGDGLETGR